MGDFSTGVRQRRGPDDQARAPKEANRVEPQRLVATAATADEMTARGRELASVLDVPAVILLEGPLGAGKTTFARGLLQGLGVFEGVKSPSFDLVHRHQGREGPVLHVDLYRLLPGDASNEVDPGLLPAPAELDADEEDAFRVVEWGAPWAVWYRDRIEVGIVIAASGLRTVTVTPVGRWQSAPRVWERLPPGWCDVRESGIGEDRDRGPVVKPADKKGAPHG